MCYKQGIDGYPIVPERPIEADDPQGVPVDDAGRLTETIDGDPLVAPHVAGRRRGGGGDEALQFKEQVKVGEDVTGNPLQAVSALELPDDSVGAYYTQGRDADAQAIEPFIQYNRNLRGRDRDNVVAHELGHAIDDAAAGLEGIPLTGAEDEFGLLYHMQQRRKPAPSLSDPPQSWTTPEDLGYSPDDASFEQMAEGMRLYLQNPAYMKEHVPNAARRIRDSVNADPRLNRTIQFNEFGVPLGLGALGASGLAPRPGSVTAFGPVMAGRRAVVAAAERRAPVTVRGDKPCRQNKSQHKKPFILS